MTRKKTLGEFELQALAAIGEALLFNNRGNRAAVQGLFKEGVRFVSSNVVLKALTEVCKNAAHDPTWRTSTEARMQMYGRVNADQQVRELLGDLDTE